MTKVDQHQAAMMAASPELYDRILDTPGFAFHFNALCLLARQSQAEARTPAPRAPETESPRSPE